MIRKFKSISYKGNTFQLPVTVYARVDDDGQPSSETFIDIVLELSNTIRRLQKIVREVADESKG